MAKRSRLSPGKPNNAESLAGLLSAWEKQGKYDKLITNINAGKILFFMISRYIRKELILKITQKIPNKKVMQPKQLYLIISDENYLVIKFISYEPFPVDFTLS